MNEKAPVISVVMAVYNAEMYLRQALNSILGQTFYEIEVICVDDGSTDSSLCVLQEYAQKDDRIVVLKNHVGSKSAAMARNIGVDAARGEYLSILDADDFFEPNMLEKAYGKAKSEDADAVLFDGYVYDDELKADIQVSWILKRSFFPNKNWFTPKENRKALFEMNLGAAWNILFRSSLIKKNRICFIPAFTDDQVFVCLALACAGRITCIYERLIHYRKNTKTSQTAGMSSHPEAGYAASDLLKEQLIERKLYEEYHLSFVNHALTNAAIYLEEIDCGEKFEQLFQELKKRCFLEWQVDQVAREDFMSDELYRKYRMIRDKNAVDYLLWQKHKKDTEKRLRRITRKIGPLQRIVIYGAGEYGKKLFTNILEYKAQQVVAWVDRDAGNIGFPVKAPEILSRLSYDFLIITVMNRHIYHEILNDLLIRGVEKHKILWLFEGEENDER